jgi:hypothetical protein
MSDDPSIGTGPPRGPGHSNRSDIENIDSIFYRLTGPSLKGTEEVHNPYIPRHRSFLCEMACMLTSFPRTRRHGKAGSRGEVRSVLHGSNRMEAVSDFTTQHKSDFTSATSIPMADRFVWKQPGWQQR